MRPELDLSNCDREPIHIPGSVQPHGLLLAVARDTLQVRQCAGAAQSFLGLSCGELIGRTLSDIVDGASGLALHKCEPQPVYLGALRTPAGEADVVGHLVGERLLLELEHAPQPRKSASEMAQIVESGTGAFTSAKSIPELCSLAASLSRSITGFDRVMIYRFLPDETGTVLAEDRHPELAPFLHHRYPASDIPRQARELYLRNVIRVIPQVDYAPSPLHGADPADPPLDMSNCHLRSVSPIHVQYLKNMEVGASASVSLVREGRLWGLVACHHRTARHLSFEDRMICRLLAAALSQQIAALEDASFYKARIRSRAAEDGLLSVLARGPDVEEALESHLQDLLAVVRADGVAVRRGQSVVAAGRHPTDNGDLLALADWLLSRPEGVCYASDSLSRELPSASAYADLASGLLSATVSSAEPHQLLWFRAEQVEVINWAGNPHKPAEPGAKPGTLTPRHSFEVWRETVRGRSEPWTGIEIEAASRLARSINDLKRNQTLEHLNETLRKALADRDSLLTQRNYLILEGNHRIQNSLQIVSGMLTMQLKETRDPVVRMQLEEALNRVNAVALVHRRLYRSDQPQTVDLDSYITELMAEIGKSLGPDWSRELRLHTTPMAVPTEMAMSVGLVITELVLNAVKYAYGGAAGAIEVELQGRNEQLQVTVRDWGTGNPSSTPTGGGFGLKLISGLVARLRGTIERAALSPGLKVTVAVPLQ
jgi:two-component system, chemotaxis family, sensor kinase Cph1